MIQLIILDIIKKDQYDGVATLFNSLLKSLIHLETDAKKKTKISVFFYVKERQTVLDKGFNVYFVIYSGYYFS